MDKVVGVTPIRPKYASNQPKYASNHVGRKNATSRRPCDIERRNLMEVFVLSLYGLWFWLTRKYRAARYREAADSLKAARIYLLNDFGTRASARDRGYMLSHQVEALDLLEHHSAFIAQTSRRSPSPTTTALSSPNLRAVLLRSANAADSSPKNSPSRKRRSE